MSRQLAYFPAMWEALRPRVGAAVFGLTCLAASIADAGRPPGVVARSGDKLSAAIVAGDSDAYAVDLATGSSLGVTLKGKLPLTPSIRVFDPTGAETNVAALVKGAGSAAPKLKGFVAGAGLTGTWKVLVEGANATAGTYVATFAVKHPAAVTQKGVALPANGALEIEFAADTGATVTATITEKSGGPIDGASVLRPNGVAEQGGGTFTRKSTKLTLAPLVAGGGFGRYRLALDAGATDAVVDVSIKVKFAKILKRTATLAPEPTVTSLAPAAVRQGAVGVGTSLVGADFLPGTEFEFDDAGLHVGAVTETGTTLASFPLGADATVPFGPHTLTAYPPPLSGEPFRVGDVTVLAPDPTLTAVSLASVKQLATDVTFECTGTGFRSGGTITVSGAGVTAGTTTVASPTRAVTTFTVAADVTLGPRDVSFTQPVAGGGAAVTLPNAFSVFAPDPQLTSISLASLRQGDTNVRVTLTGNAFRDGGTVAVSGSGVTISSPTRVSDTSFRVDLGAGSAAAFGARDVTYTQPSGGGGASVALTGALTVRAPLPAISGVSPATLRQGDTATVVTVTGTGFRSGGAIALSGTGLTLGATTIVDETTATVGVTADAAAAFGARDVTYTQPAAGGGDAVTTTGAVTVKAPLPAISVVSPGFARQGNTGVTLTLTGAGLRTGGTITASAAGVTVGTTTVTSPTQATTTIDVAGNAALGAGDITFTQPVAGGGDFVTAKFAFVVNAPIPTVTSASPATLRQGDTAVTLTLTGTSFRTGGAITLSGTGLTLGSTTVVNGTTATVPVTVDAAATFGARDATFTQPASGGGDAATQASAFVVSAPVPTVTSASPGVVKQNDSNVTVTVTGTGFRTGGTLTISGTGLTLGSTSVTNGTTATVGVTVASNATVGARNITFAQPVSGGGDAATATGALTVNHPDPTFTALSPSTVLQGQTSVSFTVTGTSFRDAATISFGADVTVQSATRDSETQYTVVADIGAAAAFGLRNATYTQPASGGGASATLTNGLRINAPTPTVTSVSPTILKQGQTSATLTVNGTNFRSGGAISISGTNLTLGSTTINSSTQATVPVTVADAATIGTRDVTFTQPASGGGAAGTGTALLTINYPDPTITSVSPTQVAQGSAGTFTVNGTGFRSSFSLTTTGTGVTLSSLTLVSATQVTASYSVAGGATISTRDLTYTQHASGGGAATTRTSAYSVLSAAPTVSSTNPSVWLPGQTNFTVRIAGTGFNSGTTVSSSGSGVTITNLSNGSPDTGMTLRVTVASNATLGARDLTITPGSGGGPAATFTSLVTIAPADPEVTSFSHATLAQGATSVSVTVLGQNFRANDTISASGSNVTFSSVSVTGTTVLTASATVSGGASTGLRNLIVTHSSGDGGRAGSLVNAFRVTAATPTVTAMSPSAIAVTGSGGPTRDVPVTITGTNFMTGAALSLAKTSGGGVSVKTNSESVVSDTTLTAVLTITGTATTGTWNVTVTNPSSLGNATANNLLTVNSSATLTVNSVIESSGATYGGERVTIHGGGFSSDAVVDFGSVRALATQVLDQNTLVTTVPQPASVSATASTTVSVTVTPAGSGSGATLTNAWSYAPDGGARFFVSSPWPAQGATGLPGNLRRSAVLLNAPCDTSTGTHSTSPSNSVNTFWFLSGGSVVSTGRSFGPLGRWLVMQRTTGTLATGTYVVSVPDALHSIGGRALHPVRLAVLGGADQYSYGVTSGTTDSTAPTLSTISPASGAGAAARMSKIVLVFSEEIDPLTVTTTNIALSTGGNAVGATLELAADLRTVTLTPHMRLAASALHTTTIGSGVTDMCGNAITSTAPTFTTNSGDATSATIDAVIVDRLPASVDGSGTYVNSSGTGGNAFDVFLPRNGFLLDVRFSDADSGIDPTTFSATCSVAVGSSSANAELASNFTVTGSGATWRIPSGTDIAAGENVVFTFSVTDLASNTAATSTITIDVVDKDTTCTGDATIGHTGGDHDLFDSRQTVVLRTDFDAYTVTYSGSGSSSAATTTAASDNVSDFEQALRYIGLGTGSMTSAAAATVNGTSAGTNAITSRLVLERIREVTRARYDIAEDGSRSADSVNVEFLLPGEQGSLASLPAYSTTNSANSGSSCSEITIGGTLGAESGGAPATLGQAYFDPRNLFQEANLNSGVTGQITGIYLLGVFKRNITASTSTNWGARVLGKFVSGNTGATPVGESSDDDEVLAGTFDRTSGGNTAAQNARYDAIMDAVELVALYTSAIVAHEVGHSSGLVPNGAPKTGLFGNAHYSNTFTEATSTVPNTSAHLDFLGNDIMSASVSIESTFYTGTEFKRFSALDIAYLLQRLFFDEGR